jgi:hypothetical protein
MALLHSCAAVYLIKTLFECLKLINCFYGPTMFIHPAKVDWQNSISVLSHCQMDTFLVLVINSIPKSEINWGKKSWKNTLKVKALAAIKWAMEYFVRKILINFFFIILNLFRKKTTTTIVACIVFLSVLQVLSLFNYYYTPAQQSCKGGILESACPSVRLSVRPSVRPAVGFFLSAQ